MSNGESKVLHRLIAYVEQSLMKTKELPEDNDPDWWLDHLAGRVAAYELILEYVKEMEELNDYGRV